MTEVNRAEQHFKYLSSPISLQGLPTSPCSVHIVTTCAASCGSLSGVTADGKTTTAPPEMKETSNIEFWPLLGPTLSELVGD